MEKKLYTLKVQLALIENKRRFHSNTTYSWDDIVENQEEIFSPSSPSVGKHVVLVPLSHAW